MGQTARQKAKALKDRQTAAARNREQALEPPIPAPAPAPAPRRPARRRRASNDAEDNAAEIAALELRHLRAQVDIEEQRLRFQQEDRERRMALDERESQARIDAMTIAPQAVTPALGDPLGELARSPEVQRFYAMFPLVPQKQLVRVYKWPNPDYDPSEIYKLSLDSAFDSVDDTFESTMTVSGMVHTKRKGRKEDYKSPTVWSTAFLLWQAIRVTYSKDIDLYLKLHKFHAKIMRLAATYAWDGVLSLAIHLYTVYYNDLEAS
jgi:hypothetical protein